MSLRRKGSVVRPMAGLHFVFRVELSADSVIVGQRFLQSL